MVRLDQLTIHSQPQTKTLDPEGGDDGYRDVDSDNCQRDHKWRGGVGHRQWRDECARPYAYAPLVSSRGNGSGRIPSTRYFKTVVRLLGDNDLPGFFEMYATEVSFHLIVTIHEEILDATSYVYETIVVIPLENPTPSVGSWQAATNVGGSAQPTTMEEDVRESDMFDNEEEYVGVNDEHLYVPPKPAQPSEIPSQSSQGPSSQPSATRLVRVIHDLENPKIEKDALFPDIISYRKEIRHYAIKKGFEFANLETDPTRFIAKYHAKGCPWRIRASRIYDSKTNKNKVLPFDHNCASTKLREGKMATQGWIADIIGDWVKKNPQKKAKDAKEKLEEQ
ncbi:hypothetical protein OsJ_31341 [Oryza sativa Japonica Group]|uniref:Transposase MuDR plant domain-containing protein n=2 Tax=Oryza sativa subsp. japonica TaxID=39947 RepID=A0A8J8Y145_ORYSJ|nr:hypothetical protein LOC_Os10g24830 [Oryza sativa Japonica Group]EAZ15920.1 hypothetical protein OsJ_31341 [Oryza sativa Japonica Group]